MSVTANQIASLTITRGLPASGKTTWAEQQVASNHGNTVRVSRDDLREKVFGGAPNGILDPHGEKQVTLLQAQMVSSLLMGGYHVIIDDTNLKPEAVKQWHGLARSHGADFHIKDFHTSPEECLKRNKARGDSGGRMVQEFVFQMMVDNYFINGALPPLPEGVTADN